MWTRKRCAAPRAARRKSPSNRAKFTISRSKRCRTIAAGSWTISTIGCRAKSSIPCRARSRRRDRAALGRLAFSDNYLRLVGRFRREMQQATHADALYQSVNSTGLALRDGTPRVYVLAAAGGGVSGCLTDIGFALRRLLRQLHHPESPVTALVFCGAPDDPATPAERTGQRLCHAHRTEPLRRPLRALRRSIRPGRPAPLG